ncbi:hypothetical protein D9M72_144560 [compost metagenome]
MSIEYIYIYSILIPPIFTASNPENIAKKLRIINKNFSSNFINMLILYNQPQSYHLIQFLKIHDV